MQENPKFPSQTIKGTTISQSYTVILRQGYVEVYENAKGPWEKRDIPDFLFTPEETEGLEAFLITADNATAPTGMFLNVEQITQGLRALDEAYKAISVTPGDSWYGDPQVKKYYGLLSRFKQHIPGFSVEWVETEEQGMTHALYPTKPTEETL